MWCVKAGGEVEFIWDNKTYSITHPDGKISVCEGDHYREAFDTDTADEALEFRIGGTKLRDIITQVTVIARMI